MHSQSHSSCLSTPPNIEDDANSDEDLSTILSELSSEHFTSDNEERNQNSDDSSGSSPVCLAPPTSRPSQLHTCAGYQKASQAEAESDDFSDSSSVCLSSPTSRPSPLHTGVTYRKAQQVGARSDNFWNLSPVCLSPLASGGRSLWPECGVEGIVITGNDIHKC